MTEATDLHAAVSRLTSSIDQLRMELVRKDVYDADEARRKAAYDDLRDDVKDLGAKLDKAEERRAADRRLVMTSFAFPVLLVILQLYLAAQTGTR